MMVRLMIMAALAATLFAAGCGSQGAGIPASPSVDVSAASADTPLPTDEEARALAGPVTSRGGYEPVTLMVLRYDTAARRWITLARDKGGYHVDPGVKFCVYVMSSSAGVTRTRSVFDLSRDGSEAKIAETFPFSQTWVVPVQHGLLHLVGFSVLNVGEPAQHMETIMVDAPKPQPVPPKPPVQNKGGNS